jgi:hypothetical protein
VLFLTGDDYEFVTAKFIAAGSTRNDRPRFAPQKGRDVHASSWFFHG